MHGRKLSRAGNPYPTYKPYPLSWDSKHNGYSPDDSESPETASLDRLKNASLKDFPDLIGDPAPAEWLPSKPITSNRKRSFSSNSVPAQSYFWDPVSDGAGRGFLLCRYSLISRGRQEIAVVKQFPDRQYPHGLSLVS